MRTPFLIAAAFMFAAASTHAAGKPNVLFIAADDLRNDLGCYGHPLVKTPHLDALAKRGVVFNNAYCQQAVCNPSRASLMTGRRVDTLRVWNLTKHFRDQIPDVVTLPQHFQKHGYFAQNIGKIYHNFRQEIQGDPASWNVPAVLHYGSHGDDKPQVEGELPPSSASDLKCECRDVPDEAYYDGRVAQLSVEALRKLAAKPEQPFFLAVGFWKPHSPFNAPKRYWDMYRREEVPAVANPEWPIDAPRIAWHNSREILGEPARKLTPEAVQEIRHGYLANISYMDAQIGKVLDELDRLKLRDNTIIVFWSDHGYHLGEQTLWAKTSCFELDARVPLIIARPQGKQGVKTDALAELLDLYPTLADLCGLPAPEGVEGVSLAPVLDDPQRSVRPAALTQHPRPAYYVGAPEVMGYSVRTSDYRYAEWRDWKSGDTVGVELYDHENDPLETRNLADDPRFSARVREGAKVLESFNPIVRPGWEPVLTARPEDAPKKGSKKSKKTVP